jgi:hypothetical protein
MLPFILVISFLLPVSNGHARIKLQESLWEEFFGKKVATFVAEPIDSSGKSADLAKMLRKAIEEELSTRLNIDFDIVTVREGADIVIDCDIKDVVWEGKPSSEDASGGADKGIFGFLGGGEGGRAEAVFTVTDLRIKKVLWQKRLMATVGGKGDPDLTPDERLSERLTRVFMKECFAKKKLRAAFPAREGDPVGSY